MAYTLRSAARMGLIDLVDLFKVEVDDFLVNLNDLQAIVHELNTEVFGSLLTFAFDPAGHMTTITISVDREEVGWQTYPTPSTWAKPVPGAPPTRSHKVYEGGRFKYERAPLAWRFSATRRPYTHYEAVEGAASSEGDAPSASNAAGQPRGTHAGGAPGGAPKKRARR